MPPTCVVTSTYRYNRPTRKRKRRTAEARIAKAGRDHMVSRDFDAAPTAPAGNARYGGKS